MNKLVRYLSEHYKYSAYLAALLMLLPLPVMQYIGEEGLMALKSYEMFVRDDWLHPSILGIVWPHSPLWHWPVMGFALLLGWEHVDIAVRLVSVCASWLTAITVGWMAHWLFGRQHPYIGWLAGLIYLTLGEVSFWYGWLGYVDATFGFFIFSATAFLWRAIAEERAAYFIASLGLISLAFMTKNITAYALYGAAMLVMLWQCQKWHVLKYTWVWPASLLALSVPVFWQIFVVPVGANTATTSIHDVLRNITGYGLGAFIWHWISFPVIFLFRALPLSIFFAWLYLRHRYPFSLNAELKVLLGVLLICFLPFWLPAGATPRYLVPLYGWVALILTALLLQLDAKRRAQSLRVLVFFLLLKIPFSLLILPGVKDWMPERDVKAVAQEVAVLVGDKLLYTRDAADTGLAVVAYLDVWEPDKQPVYWYDGHKKDVFVLTRVEVSSFGQLVHTWRIRGNHIYLYWTGIP